MTDDTEPPAGAGADGGERGAPEPDADAWSAACQEDLAAERERRQQRYGAPSGHTTEEWRRLADTVADRIAEFSAPFAGAAAQGAVQRLIGQAKTALEPVLERNPRVFDHLAAAGQELLAAYRVAVEDQDQDQDRTRPQNGAGSGADTGFHAPDPGAGPQGPSGAEPTGRD